MHRSVIGTILFATFAVSAVFGSCVMTIQFAHDDVCPAGSSWVIVCLSSAVRDNGLLAIVLISFAAVMYLHIAGRRPFELVAMLIPRLYERTFFDWMPFTGLRPLFSDGILNAKAY